MYLVSFLLLVCVCLGSRLPVASAIALLPFALSLAVFLRLFPSPSRGKGAPGAFFLT